jgi:hypothetical protein
MQQRHHYQPLETQEQCLAAEAGAIREVTIRKARQAETGSHLSDWLRSPGLKAPS